MGSECSGCGARVNDGVAFCAACGNAVEPASAPTARPIRKRLSIPFATIVAVGFAGALVLGSGRAATGQPSPNNQRLTASIDGTPVQISGPEIALVQRAVATSNAQQGSPR